MSSDCIFCKIRSGEIPSEILHSNEACFVIRDIQPKAPTHLLVIPNEHVTFVSTLGPQHDAVMGSMYRTAHEAAHGAGISGSGYRLVVNQRGDAGQEVDHLHLHVLGGRRLGGMG